MRDTVYFTLPWEVSEPRNKMSISFSTVSDSKLWTNPDKPESILFNPITNTFKYSPKGTVMQLSLQ